MEEFNNFDFNVRKNLITIIIYFDDCIDDIFK